MLLDQERNRRIVDGFRAVGILLVVLFHSVFGAVKVLSDHDDGDMSGVDQLVRELPDVLNIAWQALGSEVIFLLSGFLLAYLLLREWKRTGGIRVRDFWLRRASRILPMYALALALFAPFARYDAPEFLWNVLFISKILHSKTILPVGWSLELLVQVYLLLPLVVLGVVKARRPQLVIAVLVVLSVVARFVGLATHPDAYQTPLYTLLYGGDATDMQQDLYYLIWFRATPFLVGLWAAYLVVFQGEALQRLFASGKRAHAVFAAAVGLLVVSAFLPLHDQHSFLYGADRPTFWLAYNALQRPIFCFGATALLLVCCYSTVGAPGFLGRRLTWAPFATISQSIYPIYLFHFVWLIPAAVLVLWTTDKDAIRTVPTLDLVGIFVLTSFFAVKFAAWVTRKFELPAQNWLRSKWIPPRQVVLEPQRSDASPASAVGSPTPAEVETRS